MNIEDEKIEDEIAEQLYVVLTRQDFYDFYMSETKSSLTAHIQCDDNCPSKEQIKEQLKELFRPVIRQTKVFVRDSKVGE